MKKIKILIVIFITLIIVILLLLLFLKYLESNKNSVKGNEMSSINNYINLNNIITTENFAITENAKPDDKLQDFQRVIKWNDYYTIEQLINVYISNINNKKFENLYNIISKDYIQKNGINVNNIKNYVTQITEEATFIAREMYYVEGRNIQTYSVYGEVWNINNTEILKKEYYIVDIDPRKF